MSPRAFLLTAAGLSAAVAALILFRTGSTPGPMPLVTSTEKPSPPAPRVETPQPIAATPPEPAAVPSPPSPAAPAAAPGGDLARIETAITVGRPASLPVIAPYLTHADPALREAARDAMLQMGLAEAVPLLREAAGKIKDPREAIALLDAADLLSLPAIPATGGKLQKVPAPPPPQQKNNRPAGKSTSALGH